MQRTTHSSSRWRDADGRFRAWLRITIVALSMMVATGLTQTSHLLMDTTPARLVGAGLMAVVAAGLFTWLTRRLDRRPVRSYGLALDTRWWTDLAAGVGIGLLIGLTAVVVLVAGGWAEIAQVWSPGAAQPAVGAALVAAVAANAVVATWEELVFRGHMMSNAREALARTRSPKQAVIGAWVISTVVFAVIHGNQMAHPDIPATVGLLWLAMGGLFGLAYVSTGQLGLPIGIHLAGNLSFGPLFGLSGALNPDLAEVIRLDLDGPGWIVGAGGVAQLAGVAVAYLALWTWLMLRRRPATVEQTPLPAARNDHEHAH